MISNEFLTCSCKNLTVAFLHHGRFLTTVPRVLAEIYHSLGTQLPDVLVAVLPPDFFSDDSVAKDSISPSASSLPQSTQGLVSDCRDRLEDLRNRSGNKRRWGGCIFTGNTLLFFEVWKDLDLERILDTMNRYLSGAEDFDVFISLDWNHTVIKCF